MNVLWIVLIALLVPQVKSLLTSQTNDSVTTELLVKEQGYPFENHTVITKDGYILKLHRIPYSPRVNSSSSAPRPIAFLMHGLAGSSSDYVLLGEHPKPSLAFVLSDAGFDVWMGNARGSTYSKKNTNFSTKSSQFWNFTWHEISVIDLPTMIDYISNATGVQKVRYFAHSQGTTNYLVLVSVIPEWNDRFISVHLMSPVAFICEATNNFLNIASPLLGQPNVFREAFGSLEFKPSKEIVQILKLVVCNGTIPERYRVLCDNSVFLTTEFNKDTVRFDAISAVLATSPSPVSLLQYEHFMQLFNSCHFRQYDYSAVRNLEKYGTLSPPDYELGNIKGPVFLYYGKSDKFVDRADLDKLINKLPSSALAGLYVVPIENFDHLAFLYSDNVHEKVYKYIMRDVASIN